MAAVTETNYTNVRQELEEFGYSIVHNVLTSEECENAYNMFNEWKNTIPDHDYIHNSVDPHGIYKYHQVGHQRFAWLARTNEKIIDIFKTLWDTDELVTSFDGCCYYPKDYKGENRYWTHTDQSPQKKGLHSLHRRNQRDKI